ncbi:MAG: DUF1538 domain-containing protein [Acholeplasmataceae bacterium]
MTLLMSKLKENIFAMLPIVFIVLFLGFTYVPMEPAQWIRFLIGAFLIVIGLSLFLVGVDLAITPLGSLTGAEITKTNKLIFVLIAAFVLGFVISVAEPGLLVFAQQVETVTEGAISSRAILMTVSIGLALLVVLGFLRIIFNIPLFKILIVLYIIIGIMALFSSPTFLAIAFDASGATTGVLAVPFLLALSIGISKLKRDTKSSEKDSFGLVAIASAGAIMGLLILGFFAKDLQFADSLETEIETSNHIILPFIKTLPLALVDTLVAFSPLLGIFIIMQIFGFKLKNRALFRMIKGFIYSLLGLLIFLVGVNAGFMEIGNLIGRTLALHDHKIVLIITSFLLGLFTIIAEPAVSVLTHQIEDITAGYVKRPLVLFPLSVGVGFAIVISVIKIMVPGMQLWHILLPGYLLSLTMMFFVPKLFVGIAFDAGGVATGPLTATFTLAFVQGVANATDTANLVTDGFGMIALVALAPIITLQILGFVYKIRTRKAGV